MRVGTEGESEYTYEDVVPLVQVGGRRRAGQPGGQRACPLRGLHGAVPLLRVDALREPTHRVHGVPAAANTTDTSTQRTHRHNGHVNTLDSTLITPETGDPPTFLPSTNDLSTFSTLYVSAL